MNKVVGRIPVVDELLRPSFPRYSPWICPHMYVSRIWHWTVNSRN